MGRPRPPLPVKLIVGMLSTDGDLLRRARQLLSRAFGAVDAETELWPFEHTAYYREEMGEPLLRQFLSFADTISPERLAEIKRYTNELEASLADEALAVEHPRPVNLDPGYVDLGKLVLATTKDRSHRIYISGGVYAEVTLMFTEGAWRAMPWTYPDYAEPRYHGFLATVRELLKTARSLHPSFEASEQGGVVIAREGGVEPIPLADELRGDLNETRRPGADEDRPA